MRATRLGTLALTTIAFLVLPTPATPRTLAPITGYGELQFGVTKKTVESAYPECTWQCTDRTDRLQTCTAREPGITDMDQLAVVYIGGVLGKIVMTTRTVTSNVELLSAWNKYKGIFVAKYGPPSSISETMLTPYDNTLREFLQYGRSAIGAGKCFYAATWSDGAEPNAPGISLVLKAGWVLVAYESTAFQDYVDELKKKDAEQF